MLSIRLRLLALCCLLPAFLLLSPIRPVHAATTWVVTSLADTLGTCPDPANCTLRQAIVNAVSGDSIDFSLSGTITLSSALPIITKTLTIDGSGQNVTISGGGARSVFAVTNAGNFTVKGLTIAQGLAVGIGGGGINNFARLTVIGSTFTGNSTTFRGGGIFNDSFSSLSVSNSTFSGNSASAGGGGIFNNGGTVTVTGSTFSTNSSSSTGGGIQSTNGTLTVTNSTFSGNSATGAGGGLLNAFSNALSGTTTVTNSTFSSNSAPSGANISNSSGTLNVANTIVANPIAGPICSGTITDQSGNVEFPTNNTCGFSVVNGDSFGDPNLGSLANNGGPTQTMALLPGSAAIDVGISPACTAAEPGGAGDMDQRGLFRDTGGAITTCDAGAFELNAQTAAATTTTAGNAAATFSASSQTVTLNATVTSTGGTVNDGTVTFTILTGGSVTIGTATTSSTITNGAASVSYTLPGGTGAGSYTIQAVYNPAANPSTDFAGSSDSTHTLTIGAAGASVTLTGIPNPAGIGQPVTYTATVNSAGGTPTGSVTFTDTFNGQTTTLGTVVLVNGVAVLTTSYTEAQVGAHSIVATYTSSSANFSGGVSNTLEETVQGCQILASVVVPHARLGVAASTKGGIQYITFEENGGSLIVLRPLTILNCSGLGAANAQVSVQGMASKVRALPGVGAGPIRVTFLFGAGGVVSGVVVQDQTSNTTFTLPAPFQFGTGIHITAG